MVFGGIRLADGSIVIMCARGLPMVPALAVAVVAVDVDAADHHLDSEHYSYLLRLASAHTGTAMDSSWLDRAARIRIGRNSGCNYRSAPHHTTRRATMLSAANR